MHLKYIPFLKMNLLARTVVTAIVRAFSLNSSYQNDLNQIPPNSDYFKAKKADYLR